MHVFAALLVLQDVFFLLQSVPDEDFSKRREGIVVWEKKERSFLLSRYIGRIKP